MSEMVERVARAIYLTHWRPPSPAWEAAAGHTKEWSRKQAVEALMEMQKCFGEMIEEEIRGVVAEALTDDV